MAKLPVISSNLIMWDKLLASSPHPQSEVWGERVLTLIG